MSYSPRPQELAWQGCVPGSHPGRAFVGEYYRAWRPGIRQAVRLLPGAGPPRCEALEGIESVPEAFAFDFAFRALGAEFVIDSSKRTAWAGGHVRSGRHRIRLIHLLRDPRGWYESQRRRDSRPLGSRSGTGAPKTPPANRLQPAAAFRASRYFYDDTAARPRGALPEICDFLGFSFHPGALECWRKPHHAFAASEASSPLLTRFPGAATMPILATGADSFCHARGATLFVHERSKTGLPRDEQERIAGDPRFRELLARHGRVPAPGGLAPAEPAPFSG